MSDGIIVHEWLSRAGGSENVFDRIAALLPDADVLCLWNDVDDRYDGRNVQETWLARTPLRRSKALALPVMPAAWRSVPAKSYDWAVISSHLFAHHCSPTNSVGQPSTKVVYVHTPARYVWVPDLDQRGAGLLQRPVMSRFKRLDHRRAQTASHVIANSNYISRRIADCWELASEVVYPAVDTALISGVADWYTHLDDDERCRFDRLPTDFVLGASRFVPYKKLDQVIRTAEILDCPVVLAGSGPDERRLRDIASRSHVPVYFVIHPSSAFLYTLYTAARLYIFPPIEDFGIMPVEAMAAGTPVVVNREGGAPESVMAPRGGSECDFSSTADIRRAAELAEQLDSRAVQEHASLFSVENFEKKFSAELGKLGIETRF